VHRKLLELKRSEVYVQFRLLAGLSQQKLWFDPRLVYVRLLVDKMSLGQTSVFHCLYHSIDAKHISFNHRLRCIILTAGSVCYVKQFSLPGVTRTLEGS
jgi:hypothetical protein